MSQNNSNSPDLIEQARRFLSDMIGGLEELPIRIFGGHAETTDQLVLMILRDGPATAAQITEKAGIGSGALYPALFRLEQSGRVFSDWVPGTYPRKRLYRLSESEYATPMTTNRDLVTNPYSPDEQRVTDFLKSRTAANQGSPLWHHTMELPQEAINDPIGFLIAAVHLVDQAAATPAQE